MLLAMVDWSWCIALPGHQQVQCVARQQVMLVTRIQVMLQHAVPSLIFEMQIKHWNFIYFAIGFTTPFQDLA